METLNVVQARKTFSELMARVAYRGQRVVVERKGRPMMALVSIEDLRRLEALDEDAGSVRARREAALAAATGARARMTAERAGVPLPDSAEVLDQLREERSHDDASLR